MKFWCIVLCFALRKTKGADFLKLETATAPAGYGGLLPDSSPLASGKEFVHPDRAWLHLPQWYQTQDFTAPHQAAGLLKEDDYTGRYLEDRIITELFYPPNYSGVIVEVGGNDGIVFSSSLTLEKDRGWRAIIIEGDPVIAKYVPQLRPNAVVANAIVCHDWGVVQFAPMGTQGGILETMPRFILENFHPYLLDPRGIGEITEQTLQHAKIPVVGCIPLGWLLQQLNLNPISVLFIDINGAEFSALSSINFDVLQADVVAVNVDERRAETNASQAGCEVYMKEFNYLPWNLADADPHEPWMDDLHANRILYFIRSGSVPAVRLGLSSSV